MKEYIMIIILLLVFISCGTTEISEHKTEEYYELAYRKYIEKGFLFCRSECVDKYKPIGKLSMQAYPSLRVFNFKADTANQGSLINDFEQAQIILDYNEVIDSFFTYAVKLGADAVINLEIRKETDIYKTKNVTTKICSIENDTKKIKSMDNLKSNTNEYSWIDISGLAIKRAIIR